MSDFDCYKYDIDGRTDVDPVATDLKLYMIRHDLLMYDVAKKLGITSAEVSDIKNFLKPPNKDFEKKMNKGFGDDWRSDL